MSHISEYLKRHTIEARSPSSLVREYLEIICKLMDLTEVPITAAGLALGMNKSQVDIMLRALGMRDVIAGDERLKIALDVYHLDPVVDRFGREKISLRLQVMDERLVRRLGNRSQRFKAVTEIADAIAGDMRWPKGGSRPEDEDCEAGDMALRAVDENTIEARSPSSSMQEYLEIICKLMDLTEVPITAEGLALRLSGPEVDTMLRALGMRDVIAGDERLKIALDVYRLDPVVDRLGREKILLRLQVMDERLVRRLGDPSERLMAVAELADAIAGDMEPREEDEACEAGDMGLLEAESSLAWDRVPPAPDDGSAGGVL